MKNYIVEYLKPDGKFVKTFKTKAESPEQAATNCREYFREVSAWGDRVPLVSAVYEQVPLEINVNN